MIPIATQYTSYTQARDNFVKVLEEEEQGQGIVVVQRRGHEDVAMIAAAELSALLEEVYLLRSPANARRLHAAISWAQEQTEQPLENSTVETLRAEMEAELGQEKAQ
jgi:antitoxin YefM